jgi:hypothetical protein
MELDPQGAFHIILPSTVSFRYDMLVSSHRVVLDCFEAQPELRSHFKVSQRPV